MRKILTSLVVVLGAIVLLAVCGLGQTATPTPAIDIRKELIENIQKSPPQTGPTFPRPDGEAVVKAVPKVAYPREAKETGLEGVVTVGVEVDEKGKVTSVGEAAGPDWVCPNVSRPDVVAMREAAKAVAAKATFTPAMKGGLAVASWAVVRVEFVDPYPNPTPDEIGNEPVNGKYVSDNLHNGVALKLPKPEYPDAARAVHASGDVGIKITIDPDGSVFAAEPVSGHPLLRSAARTAACQAAFSPTLIAGKPARVTGVIKYQFHK